MTTSMMRVTADKTIQNKAEGGDSIVTEDSHMPRSPTSITFRAYAWDAPFNYAYG
jgi:hypothetical protein